MSDEVFVKSRPWAPPGSFAAEARGLEFLRVDGGPPLPQVLDVSDDRIELARLAHGRPSPAAASDFGRQLAVLHGSAGDERYGAPFAGFIGPLPLDNTRHDDWPSFYAERRLAPYLPGLGRDIITAVEAVMDQVADLAGPAEPPARIHGDLWSGNVLWAADGRAWLIDAGAAHFGHRETDLAMLALFGAPYLDEIVDGYQDVAPLADGWRERVPLHQLHPLLVHAQLFGGGYLDQVRAAIRRLVTRRTARTRRSR